MWGGASLGPPLGFIALYRQIFKCKCRGWRPRQPDFVCSIILAISAQFFLDNLADRCYNKKAENCEKSNKVCRGTQAKSWVEKVKPDPLNLLVKTSVGSKFCVNLPPAWSGGFLFPLFHKKGIKYVKMFVSGRLGLLRGRRYTSRP